MGSFTYIKEQLLNLGNMSHRTIYAENVLRKGIYREAMQLVREGWQVMAKETPGFHNPPEIEGYTPHIYAVQGEKTIIVDLLACDDQSSEVYKAHYHYARRDITTAYFCWKLDSGGEKELGW